MIDICEKDLNDISEKELLIVNTTFAAVNALFTQLDVEWAKFADDETIELNELFASIGGNLVQYLQAYAKELNDTNDELVHALFCGVVDMLLDISNKKYLKEIIDNVNRNKKKS